MLWLIGWLTNFFTTKIVFLAKIEILRMLLEMAQHNFVNAVCFPGLISVGELPLLVGDQSYRPPKSDLYTQPSTWRDHNSDSLPINQSTEASYNRMLLTVILNFEIVLSWMLYFDTVSFILLNQNSGSNSSGFILRIFWIQYDTLLPIILQQFVDAKLGISYNFSLNS